MDVTRELARIIANNPPITVNAAKKAISLGMVAPDITEHIKHESAMNFVLTETEDSREAVQAFLEKREPRFKGQ
jgi:enoyl-CoA hydratase